MVAGYYLCGMEKKKTYLKVGTRYRLDDFKQCSGIYVGYTDNEGFMFSDIEGVEKYFKNEAGYVPFADDSDFFKVKK